MTRKRFQKLARGLLTHYHMMGLKIDYREISEWRPNPYTYEELLSLFDKNLEYELLWEGR